MQTLSGLFAALLATFLALFLFGVGVKAGDAAAGYTRKAWVGWICGIVVTIGLLWLASGSIAALIDSSCQGVSDREACLRGD